MNDTSKTTQNAQETIYELVVIDSGKETDWYDPINPDDVVETDTEYRFNNSYNDYVVEKREDREIVIRLKENDDE